MADNTDPSTSYWCSTNNIFVVSNTKLRATPLHFVRSLQLLLQHYYPYYWAFRPSDNKLSYACSQLVREKVLQEYYLYYTSRSIRTTPYYHTDYNTDTTVLLIRPSWVGASKNASMAAEGMRHTAALLDNNGNPPPPPPLPPGYPLPCHCMHICVLTTLLREEHCMNKRLIPSPRSGRLFIRYPYCVPTTLPANIETPGARSAPQTFSTSSRRIQYNRTAHSMPEHVYRIVTREEPRAACWATTVLSVVPRSIYVGRAKVAHRGTAYLGSVR